MNGKKKVEGLLKMIDEEKIYQVLRDAILFADFPPGQQLKESTLAEAFDVSRTPIRTVFQRLKFESLIKLIPKRGAFVYCPDPHEAKQIFEMRKLLEPKAVELAALHASSNQVKLMYERLKAEQKLIEEQLYIQSLVATKNFHMSIVEASGNVFLIEFLRKIITLSHIILTFYYVFEQHKEVHAIEEHYKLLEAIKNRNAEKAKQLAADHVASMQDEIDFSKMFTHSVPIKRIISKYM